MFANPVAAAILESSGAIPVQRNPNRDTTNTNGKAIGNATSSNLFKSTSQALSQNQVIGVFPEGTSYTQPGIVQVMSGAAWAAVAYVKWQQQQLQHTEVNEERRKLKIVPVGIVYTDKSHFQSRVRYLTMLNVPC